MQIVMYVTIKCVYYQFMLTTVYYFFYIVVIIHISLFTREIKSVLLTTLVNRVKIKKIKKRIFLLENVIVCYKYISIKILTKTILY